jgi:LysM repeat protein
MIFQKQFVTLFGLFILLFIPIVQPLSANTSYTSDSTKINNFSSSHQISITDSIVNFGKMLLNTPYRFGSPGADSFDCSGFTSYVYRNFGYNLEHSSAVQAQQFDTVHRSELKPGDLVFFSGRSRSKRVGHVGIVTKPKENGQFEFIHAAVGGGVRISDSEEGYYKKRFIKANRVVGGNPLLGVVPCANESSKINTQPEITAPMTMPVTKVRKTSPAKYHKVRSGETLASIANKYGLSMAEIKHLNGIKGNKIRKKQRLKVQEEETYTVVEPLQVAVNKTKVVSKKSVAEKNEEVRNETASAITSHTVKKGETLFSISKLYNIPVDELKRINNLEKGRIIPGQELKLSESTESTGNLATSKPGVQQKSTTHKVTSGESLFSISKKYKVTTQELKEMNNLTGNNIKPGQEIIINQSTETAKADLKINTALKEKEPASDKEVISSKNETYKVKKGDNLNSIAEKHNMSVNELKEINNLTGNKINLGQKLIINSGTETAKTNLKTNTALKEKEPASNKEVTSSKNETYKVKKGDNLNSIAEKHNMSVNELKEINNLTGNKINLGQKLIINSGTETAKTNLKTNTALKEKEPASNKEVTNSKNETYKVKKGDNLNSIAEKHNMSVNELKEINNLTGNKIKFGQELKISQNTETGSSKDEVTKSGLTAKSATHKVIKGESLSGIAKEYNMTVDELKELNNMTDNKINFGQELKVNHSDSEKKSTTSKAESKSKLIHHKVESGESFYSIAHKYGCTMDELREWNNKSGDKLKIGDEVVVYKK